MISWEEYKFRCSQLSKICTGTIGIKENQEAKIEELIQERDTGFNKNGNKCKWTGPKEQELVKLLKKQALPWYEQLPATMRTELRKIYRAEKYNRNFIFTNKYVQKGLAQEDEAITMLQFWLKEFKGQNALFMKNGERLHHHTHWHGEPDLRPIALNFEPYKGKKVGFDTKCSWDLSTFPFPDDELDTAYDFQNLGYAELENVDVWITAYVLVNGTEDQVHNEKMKWFYALKTKDGTPDEPDHKYHAEYSKKCKEVERNMIFDYDRFVAMNPFHDMEHSREEWFESIDDNTGNKGFDIPLKDRVLLFETKRDPERIEFMKDRVETGRKYLQHLAEQDQKHSLTI